MIYAGVDDCGIYINDSADPPRFTRTHLTEAQAFDLAIELLRHCDHAHNARVDEERAAQKSP